MKLQDLSNKGNTKTLPFTYSKYEREREVLFKAMKKNSKKNQYTHLNNQRCAWRTKLYA